MKYAPKIAVLCCLAALLFTAGCSDSADSKDSANNTNNHPAPTPTGPVEAPPARALALASSAGCAIDDDCAQGLFCFQNHCARVCQSDADCAQGTCSARGRCMDTAGQARPVLHTLAKLRVEQMPDTLQVVAADQQSVQLGFGLSAAIPPDGIAYRIERSDGLGDPTQIHLATGDKSFRVSLDTGAARPAPGQPATPVSLTIFSSVGDFEVRLEPQSAFEGTWRGTIAIDSFGGTQTLGLDAYILGKSPDDLTLVLPVGAAQLFSPRDDHDPERHYELAKLQRNPSLNVYQAVFTHEYRFDTGIFAALPARQVERTIRFDFDADALDTGRLEGRLTDLWRGLYDTQRPSGSSEAATVRYDADFTLTRYADLPKPASSFVARAPVDAQPTPIARGDLASCTPDFFQVAPVDIDGETWTCAGIINRDEFILADPDARALCALAIARRAAEGQTTSKQLADFFAEDADTGSLSFEGFLQACADDQDDTCQPSAQAHCAFDLLAWSARDLYRTNLGNDAARADHLLAHTTIELSKMSQESFLARKLGAFYNDLDLRRQWLRNSSAPSVFLDAVETANQSLLQNWTARVLDVQHDVFVHFFTSDVLTLLSRQLNGEEPNRERTAMLSEASSLWRSYAEGLTLAARRWNEVVRDQPERDALARTLKQRTLELYLVMGMLTDFNRSSDNPAQTVDLAANFGELTAAITRLGRSFNDAIFARDAEVVVARSLNPLSDNDSLLSERRAAALASVERARLAIEDILDEVSIEALQEADVRTRINDERRLSANRIAEICGLPAGCSESDLLLRPECINVEPAQCGLLNPANPDINATFDPSRVAASDAGKAVLAILEAFHNVAIQNDELAGHLAKLDLRYEELTAFKNDVEAWNLSRHQGLVEMQNAFAQLGEVRDQHVRDLTQNLDERARVRAAKIQAAQDSFTQWNQIRLAAAQSTFDAQLEELKVRSTATGIGIAADHAAAALNAHAEALPKVTGPSTDVNSALRASFVLAAQLTALAGESTAAGLNLYADRLAIDRDLAGALTDAELARLSEEAAMEDAFFDEDITQLELAAETSTLLRDNELAAIQGALEFMRAQREAELAYSRDMAEFRTKRSEFLQQMVDTSGLLLRVDMSRFNVIQRTLEYDNLVQKARLEAARLRELNHQLFDLDNLVGGMGVVFSKSYALNRAEDHLAEAREALMDWLVVLEYYAVRPFMTQRVQIELARNAYQLDAIAQDMRQLENTCGGAERSKASATLSLRNQVLGLTRGQKTLDAERDLNPDARFRQWLQQAYIPVDRRARFSTSESLTQLLQNTDSVLAATFTLGLDDFANLQLACNAKIESIAIQLVGELGDLEPTATLLYDGTSQLRSCQPNIAEYTRTAAAGMSAYDTITQLRTSGRAMSPLAGVNAFLDRDQSVNRSLAGLPVASEYTLLISTDSGDNKRLNWDALTDVLIRVEYSYQDLFSQACD